MAFLNLAHPGMVSPAPKLAGVNAPAVHIQKAGPRSAALAALRALRSVPRADPMRRGGAVSTLLRTGGAPGASSPFGAGAMRP